MAREQFTYKGLVEFERAFRRKAADVAYLSVWDRTDRGHEEALGRFELTPQDALAYLQGPPDRSRDEEDDEDTLEDLGLEDPDDGSEATDDPEPAGELTPQRLADAACRWLRDIAARNTVGEPMRRFRVRAYGPKGIRVIETASFSCKDEDWDLEPASARGGFAPAVADLTIPTPTFESAETASSVRGMRALGDYYAQWGRIVLGSVSQLQGVNNAMLGRLHRQLDASRGQVDELVGALLHHRAAEMEAAEQRRSADRSEDTRAELARHALQQLGDAAKVFLTARGVPPEMVELMAPLGQSPELLQTLADPDVRQLLHDPQNLRVVALLLRQAAEQARAARQAPPPSPPPGPQAQAS